MLENRKGSQYGWGSQARASKKHSDLKGREEPDRVGHLRSVKGFGEGNGNPLQCSCLENPGMAEPGGLPSMGSHRVRHN